jgi:hypothetical protein
VRREEEEEKKMIFCFFLSFFFFALSSCARPCCRGCVGGVGGDVKGGLTLQCFGIEEQASLKVGTEVDWGKKRQKEKNWCFFLSSAAPI